MKLIDAMKELTGLTKEKISFANIANALGMSRQYAHQLRNRELSSSHLHKLETYFNVDLTGDKLIGEQSSLNDCVTLQHVHINPSCGKGTSVYYEADITPVKLGTQLIKDILNVSKPENLKIFKACGDSMSPTIEDGDILLVDIGRSDFNNGGVFLLTINNEWFIKRLRLKITGELEIISENTQKYGEPEILRPNDEIEVVIKGRVIKNLSRCL